MNEVRFFEVVDEDLDLDLSPEIGPLCICETYDVSVPEIALLLEIDAGQAYVSCAICKHQFAPICESDDLQMDQTPVRLRRVSSCTGGHWGPCDHDSWFEITVSAR